MVFLKGAFLTTVSLVLTSTAFAMGASEIRIPTGAQKVFEILKTTDVTLNGKGDGCEMTVGKDEKGMIRVELKDGKSVIQSSVAADRVLVYANEILLQYRTGYLSGSDISIRTDGNGKLEGADGSARLGMDLAQVRCKFK